MAEQIDFSQMSDEQLLALLNRATSGAGATGTPAAPQKVTMKLSDGTVIEAKDQEELNRLLQQRLEALSAHREEEPEPAANPNPQTPTPAPWDYDKFAKMFLKDPREGIEYMETAQYGAPVTKLIPQLVMLLGTQVKKLQELEAQQFIDSTADYDPSVANRAAIEKVMQERGWQVSRQTLSDAFAIAKQQGLIAAKEQEKQETAQPGAFIPPRTSHTATNGNQTSDSDLAALAATMPMDKLEELLLQSGVLKQRHAS